MDAQENDEAEDDDLVSSTSVQDLFTVVLRNDDLQEFDSKWDEN